MAEIGNCHRKKMWENDDEPTDGMDGMGWGGLYSNKPEWWLIGGLLPPGYQKNTPEFADVIIPESEMAKCKWLESNNQFSESQLMFMAVLAITFMKIYQQRVAWWWWLSIRIVTSHKNISPSSSRKCVNAVRTCWCVWGSVEGGDKENKKHAGNVWEGGPLTCLLSFLLFVVYFVLAPPHSTQTKNRVLIAGMHTESNQWYQAKVSGQELLWLLKF